MFSYVEAFVSFLWGPHMHFYFIFLLSLFFTTSFNFWLAIKCIFVWFFLSSYLWALCPFLSCAMFWHIYSFKYKMFLQIIQSFFLLCRCICQDLFFQTESTTNSILLTTQLAAMDIDCSGFQEGCCLVLPAKFVEIHDFVETLHSQISPSFVAVWLNWNINEKLLDEFIQSI